MCESGINIDQLKISIGQIDDAIALSQQWAEQLHHLADHGKRPDASAPLAQVTVMLGEARARLDAAIAALEGEESGPGISVELV